MKFPRTNAAAAGALLFTTLMLSAQVASAQKTCPSPTDVLYPIKDDDTLSQVAARTYCVKDLVSVNNAWRSLAEYNRIPIGPNPHRIFTDTHICLPERLVIGQWRADRCVSGEPAAAASPQMAAACGNNRKDGAEICDGSDLGAMTCETLGLSAGRLACRADCGAFDPAGCAPVEPRKEPCPPAKPPEKPPTCEACLKGSQEEDRSILRRVAAELLVGIDVPFSAATRDHIYGVIFAGALGIRLTLGQIEIAPRLLFVGGANGIIFNEIEQDQRLIGGGGGLQIGVPLHAGSFRLTPGAEAGLLYVSRSIDRIDYPFEGTVETQSGYIPFVGVFFRPEYLFQPDPDAPGFNLTLELSGNLIPVSLAGNKVSENFNAKVLGGVGYAF